MENLAGRRVAPALVGRASLAATFVVALTLAGRVAVAQEPGAPPGAATTAPSLREQAVARAKDFYQRGQRLYQVGRYREALEQFKEGYLLHDDPVFLYNIGQCHRLLGERREAITFYKRYLTAAPDSPMRADVRKRVEELESGKAQRALTPSSAPSAASVAPAASSAPIAAVAPAPAPGPPLHQRWWLWAGAGALVLGAAVTFVALSGGRDGGCGAGVDYCASVSR
jgi:tetratricopeptide (TPR) repeat protein